MEALHLSPMHVTRDLIRIPSHNTEARLAGHVEDYVRDHFPAGFTTQRLEIDEPDRPTLLIANADLPDFIIISHADTVEPWVQIADGEIGDGVMDPFGGTIVDGTLYGRGAADAKSGMGAALTAVASFKGHEDDLPKTMIIFPSDEEGDLRGMRKVAEFFRELMRLHPTWKPSFVLSLNGSDDEIAVGCRGVLELEMLLKGRTGHAAVRPEGAPTPINAINAGNRMIAELTRLLEQVPSSADLGGVTTNLAGVHGGTQTPGGVKTVPNMVPDEFGATVEIRTNRGKVTAGVDGEELPVTGDVIRDLMIRLAEREKVIVSGLQTPLEVAAWLSRREGAEWLEEIIARVTGVKTVNRKDLAREGLDEMAILMEALDKDNTEPVAQVDGAVWGPYKGEYFHAPDERVTHAQSMTGKEVVIETLQAPHLRRQTHSIPS